MTSVKKVKQKRQSAFFCSQHPSHDDSHRALSLERKDQLHYSITMRSLFALILTVGSAHVCFRLLFPHSLTLSDRPSAPHYCSAKPPPKISNERRKQLGIADDEDEYDLYFALDNNTDPLITKIIAGSLILAILGLLVAGVVIPSLTDYGEGVCNPITTGGRC